MPNGVYVVWVTAGDAGYVQGPQQVVLENLTIVSGETTPPGSFLVTAACVGVTDGDLTIEAGGLTGNTILNSVRVEMDSCTPGDDPGARDRDTLTRSGETRRTSVASRSSVSAAASVLDEAPTCSSRYTATRPAAVRAREAAMAPTRSPPSARSGRSFSGSCCWAGPPTSFVAASRSVDLIRVAGASEAERETDEHGRQMADQVSLSE